MGVSAQVSLYPLGQSNLLPAIQAVWDAFEQHGLTVEAGRMSTLVEGEEEPLFAALRDGFRAACTHGATVMVVALSNACPSAERVEGLRHG